MSKTASMQLRAFEPACMEPTQVFVDESVSDADLKASLRDFRYVRTNVPGPVDEEEDDDELAERWEPDLAGCDCGSDEEGKSACDSESCFCARLFGHAYDKNGRLLPCDDDETRRRPPILECGVNCGCYCVSPSPGADLRCANRVVGCGLPRPLVIFSTTFKGLGLRTLTKVSAGSFVCEYAGEVLSRREARRRMEENREQWRKFTSSAEATNPPMNYAISAVERSVGSAPIETVVDPQRVGNLGRFINHACDPNLVVIPVRESRSVPRLALFAKRDIGALEELTFHYGGENTKPEVKPEVAPSPAERRIPCSCGSRNCSGFLPFDPGLFGEDLSSL